MTDLDMWHIFKDNFPEKAENVVSFRAENGSDRLVITNKNKSRMIFSVRKIGRINEISLTFNAK